MKLLNDTTNDLRKSTGFKSAQELRSFVRNRFSIAFSFGHAAWLIILFAPVQTPATWAKTPVVTFDVNAVAAARTIVADDHNYPQLTASLSSTLSSQYSSGPAESVLESAPSRHVEVALDISTMVTSGFRGQLSECAIRIASHRRNLQIADYWPKTTMVSSLAGNIEVSENHSRNRHAGIYAVGGYPGFVSANGNATYDSDSVNQRRYSERAPMQLIAAAGTIDRGTGIHFKVCRSAHESLEGAHEYRILLEVPLSWRADLLDVQMQAYGTDSSDDSDIRMLGQSRYLVAIFDPSDPLAQQAAIQFSQQDHRLRETAMMYSSEIRRRSAPTPIHKFGVALDVLAPEIPENWLTNFLFGQSDQYPIGSTSRLPVKVRIAVLDYLDSKIRIESLRTDHRFENRTILANHPIETSSAISTSRDESVPKRTEMTTVPKYGHQVTGINVNSVPIPDTLTLSKEKRIHSAHRYISDQPMN